MLLRSSGHLLKKQPFLAGYDYYLIVIIKKTSSVEDSDGNLFCQIAPYSLWKEGIMKIWLCLYYPFNAVW